MKGLEQARREARQATDTGLEQSEAFQEQESNYYLQHMGQQQKGLWQQWYLAQ